jgi:hypothetical protein
MTKQLVDINIKLGYLLTEYFLANPTKQDKYKTDRFIIFSRKEKRINKMSRILLERYLKLKKDVIMAIHLSSRPNKWFFQEENAKFPQTLKTLSN